MLEPVYRNYQSQIRMLGRTGTWLPGDILQLGEVGTLRRGRFERGRSLSELGIDFREKVGEPDESFTRSNATQLASSLGARANVVGQIDGGLAFTFDKKGQFFLSARQLRHRRIENIDHVCNRIVRDHQLGKWKPEWVVIDEVWTAEFLTVAISESSNAAFGLTAAAGVLTGLAALSDAALAVEISSQSGSVLYERGANKTPFFTGRKLRRRLLADNDTRQISTRGEPEETVDVLDLHFIDDLMASWSDPESSGEP